MRFYFFLLFLLIGCQSQTDQKDVVNNYGDLIGRAILCKTDTGEAQIFVYSPHVVGVPSLEKKYEVEYFRSEFAKSDGSVYFVSTLWGDKYYTTVQRSPEETVDKLRRLRITITTNKKIRVLVAQGLKGEERTPLRPMEFYCDLGPPINDFHRSPK